MLKTLGGSVVGKLNILSLVKMYSYVRKAHLEAVLKYGTVCRFNGCLEPWPKPVGLDPFGVEQPFTGVT